MAVRDDGGVRGSSSEAQNRDIRKGLSRNLPTGASVINGSWTTTTVSTDAPPVINGAWTTTTVSTDASTGTDYTVATVNDMLNITGLSVGETIEVTDAREGGFFEVKDNGQRTDGGTCYIPKEDLSTLQTIQTTNDLRTRYSLPDSDIAWKEFSVKYGPNAEEELDALQFYGGNATKDYRYELDTLNGEFGGSEMIYRQQNSWGSSGTSYDFRIKYKYATSTKRIVRQNVTNAFNIDWWGGTTRVSDGWTQDWWNADSSVMEFAPTDENTAQIAWATIRAQRAVDSNAGISTAYVDFPDMYWQLFKVFQPDNVLHRGTGAERQVGNATVKGGVKMPPNLALWHAIESGSNSYLGSTATRWESARMHKWGHTHGWYPLENKVGFHHFDLHGNLSQNSQVFDSDNYGDVGNKLQNASLWTGWRTSKIGTATNETGRGYVNGTRLVLDNTAIRRMGGNGINSANGAIVLDINNFFAGRSRRNHPIYGFAGPGTDEPAIADGIQHSGFSWSVPIKLGTWKNYNFNYNTLDNLDRRGKSKKWGATYKNITVKNLEYNIEGNGYYKWTQIFNIEKANVDIDGYNIDFTGAPRGGQIFANVFAGNDLTNGTINLDDEGARLISPFLDAIRTFLDDEITKVDGLTVNGDGSGNSNFIFLYREDIAATNIAFKNATINAPANGSQEGGYALGASLKPLDSTDKPRGRTPGAKRLTFDNVDWNGEVNKIARFSWKPDSNGDYDTLDIFISNSSFNNVGDWSIQLDKQKHAIDAGRHERIYMSNTTLNVPLSGMSGEDTFHYALSPNPTVIQTTGQGDWLVDEGPSIRLRDCDTPNGRVSDSVGNTFTSSASDEGNSFVLIPTSLLGRPFEINTTLTSSPSGISSITGVDVANSDGTLRPDSDPLEHDPYLKVNLDGTIGTGETVTIDWDARVTPLDQYSTTGTFLSRPVRDRTSAGIENPLKSGAGPFTIDLRGVAATQETWEPHEYTASSSDTSVVTANVTTTKHRDKQRAYTLELTEQGTGTATITVTSTHATLTDSVSDSFQIEVDATAPTQTNLTASADGTDGYTGSVDVDERGTTYVVVTTSSTAPTPTQVRSGNNANGNAASASESISSTSSGTRNFGQTGPLTSSTTYYVHTMSEDDAGNAVPGNQSAVATSGSFTTA